MSFPIRYLESGIQTVYIPILLGCRRLHRGEGESLPWIRKPPGIGASLPARGRPFIFPQTFVFFDLFDLRLFVPYRADHPMETQMTDQPVIPEGMMPGVNVQHVIETRTSPDGQTAMVVFQIAENGGTKFAMTLPVAALGTFQTMVGDLIRRAAAQNRDTGMVALRKPRSFAIGSSASNRGFVYVTFDQETPHEETYVMADVDGRNLAAEIERNVLSRMTPQERHQAIRKAKPILLPGLGGKLIIP